MPRTVLVAESDRDVCCTLADLLSLHDCGVMLAHDAITALHIAQTSVPCLVLFDMMLRGGQELLPALVQTGVPVVTMSTWARDPKPEGAVAQLGKPFELDKLLALVARYCGPES